MSDLNALDAEAFCAAVAWVFEGAPWVAEAAAAERPFPSLEALHAAFVGVVEAADAERQAALLQGHPELAAGGALSPASRDEQAGAGFERLSAAERTRLADLLRLYREHFGFPFVFAVRGCTASEILQMLAGRVGRSREAELREGVRQACRIAWLRLAGAVDGGTPAP